MLEFKILSSDNRTKVYQTFVVNNHAYKNPLMSVLIDTGAYLPTWTNGFDSFIRTFPNSVFANAETASRGFGLSYEVLPVYIIPEYKLTDSDHHTVCIRNLPVAVTKKDFSFSMLLGFTTFRKMNCSISLSLTIHI